MNTEVEKHNEKFSSHWCKGANEHDSKLIIAIGTTENGRFQTYTNDGLELAYVIRVLRHVADKLETVPVTPVHYDKNGNKE